MLKMNAGAVVVSGLLLLCACNRNASTAPEAAASTTPAATAAAAPAAAPPPTMAATPTTPTINASMTKVMAVHAQTIWDITSGAFNDRGDGLVGSKISEKQWAQLAEAGQQMGDRARLLANTQHVTVAGPGETIMGADAAGATPQIGHTWDAASATQIQAKIDANPTFFAERARILGKAMDTVVKASKTKDAKTLYKVSSGLDDVCDGCHKQVWGTDEPPPYPISKK